MGKLKHSYSIVVSVYNESKRIEDCLREYRKFLSEYTNCEIIFVDDGSTDDSFAKLKNTMSRPRVKLYSIMHGGKWSGLKNGVQHAENEYVVLMDLDHSVSPYEIVKIDKNIEWYNLVIGNRYKGKNDTPTLRRITSRVFNICVRLITWLNISDTQCPFKVFKNNYVSQRIVGSIKEGQWAGDVELLLRFKPLYMIKSVPVSYTFSDNSTLRLWKAAPQMLWRIFKMRLYVRK